MRCRSAAFFYKRDVVQRPLVENKKEKEEDIIALLNLAKSKTLKRK